jgi:osmotically-inducible protein OsmY
MRGFFNGLVLGIILGAAGFWFIQNKANEHPEAQQHYQQSMTDATAAASEAVSTFSDAMKAKLETLNLQPGQIKDELVKTGQVIRRKAYDIGESAADAASDVRAVAEIKAKYAGDSTLSVWKISVGCNQGHVTLSGTVSSPDDIGKAVALALDAGGVRDVTSTLQVKPSQ